jgi:type I restriction enzyme S subunit
MRKYSSYKPSGEDYIGDIPNNWECIRLGMLGVFSSSGIDKKTNDNETSVRMVNYTDIIQSRKYNPIQTGEKEYMVVSTPVSKLNEHRLIKGDMVFIPSSETKEDLGYSSLIDFDENDIVYSYHILRYRTHKNIHHYFKKYLINHHSVLNQFSRESKGTTRQIIGRNVFNNVRVVLPPIQEQEQIVNYLDEKTTIIDKLISTKQRKVELLKEQRTSLINQVITKGLNPNVKMKDSGVEWIGEIPESWEIVPLFTISKHTKEKNEDNEKVVLSLSYGNIKIRDVENNYGLLPESFNDYQRIRPGYIVLRLTDLQNDKKSLRVGLSKLDGIITPVYVSLKTNHKMLDEFLFYHLYNSDLKKILYTLGGGLRQTLRFEELKKFPVPFTTLEEQKEIVEYINKHIYEIDELVSTEQKKIELLKEYRQSLISEVITGKIKVV